MRGQYVLRTTIGQFTRQTHGNEDTLISMAFFDAIEHHAEDLPLCAIDGSKYHIVILPDRVQFEYGDTVFATLEP